MKPSRLLTLLLLIAILILFPACWKEKPSDASSQPESLQEVDPEYPVTVNGTTLTSRPAGVISLSPSLTEKLADLNLDKRLVGVSDFCDDPAEIATAERCGTTQIPELSVIESLDAQLLLSEAELSKEDTETLAQMGIEVAVIPRANSIEQLEENYLNLARLLEGAISGEKIGQKFLQTFQTRLENLSRAFSPYAEENGRKKVLYLRMLDFTVATGDTLENELLEAIGLENIAAEQENWIFPADSANAAQGRQAFESIDIIFCDESIVSIKMLEQNAFYRSLQAVLQDRYLYIDSTLFERQSLRMLDQLEEMAKYAYPDAPDPSDLSASTTDPSGSENSAQTSSEDAVQAQEMLDALESMP